MVEPRTWKTHAGELQEDLDRAVARNGELAREVKRLFEANEATSGLRQGNADTRMANEALKGENILLREKVVALGGTVSEPEAERDKQEEKGSPG